MNAAEILLEGLETPISGVASHEVVQIWDRVEPLLVRIVKPHTGWSLNSLLTALQLGQFQLWVIGDFDGVVVTQVQSRPTENVLWVQFIAGDHMIDWLDDWIQVQEAFAKEHDCKAVEFSGRAGWKKISAQHAKEYKPILTTFRREL